MAAATVASSQPLRFHSEISLDNINFYTAPPEKPRASQHHAITAPEKSTSSKPERRNRGVPLFPPKSQEALKAWALNGMLFHLGP